MDDDAAAPPTGALANLTLDQDDNQNQEAASPNTMVVDAPEEHVVEPNGTEAEDVAIINPDAMDTDSLLASDCTSPPPPPLRTAHPPAVNRHRADPAPARPQTRP